MIEISGRRLSLLAVLLAAVMAVGCSRHEPPPKEAIDISPPRKKALEMQQKQKGRASYQNPTAGARAS